MPPRRSLQLSYFANNFILTFTLIPPLLLCFLPRLVDAQQQHRHGLQQQYRSTIEPEFAKSLQGNNIAQYAEVTSVIDRSKKKFAHNKNENDASAIATLAPAQSAVAALSLRLSSDLNAETSSPQFARSLGDWEVEDFVLLATVDGTLYARDRITGKERWHISYEQPMVHIKYHSKSLSTPGKSYEATVIDDYLWIVEPGNEGNIFTYRPYGPNPGLVNTGLTIKKLVEMTPYGDEDPPVIYTGEKKTKLLTVDAHTGKVLSWFGSINSLTTKETCDVEEVSTEETEKCPTAATLIIGRTEYTVGIFGRNDGHHIATLTFSEWCPNNYDQDLQQQYMKFASTLDNKYIYSAHDGGVVSFDYEKSTNTKTPGMIFQQKFPSPVVRVFDVARPWGSNKKNANLIILHQPQLPNDETKESIVMRTNSVFLNHTEDGSWYAISGNLNSLTIGQIRPAQCSQSDWFQCHTEWNILNKTQLSTALVGLHLIESHKNPAGNEILTISGPAQEVIGTNVSMNYKSSLFENTSLLNECRQFYRIAVQRFLELLQNPMLLVVLLALAVFNQRQIRDIFADFLNNYKKALITNITRVKTDVVSEVKPLHYILKNDAIGNQDVDGAADINSKIQVPDTKLNVKNHSIANDENSISDVSSPKKKEKKTHRGRRGGVKHKKGAWNNARNEPITPKQKPIDPSISKDEGSTKTNKSDQRVKVKPTFQTLPSDSQEISGPLVRIGALEVNIDRLIGTGSNGTMVFRGKFDGREVAVKRMLIQFFDIALQETNLLRESDDHPNVIRYFAQQQAAGFLYIALELCPASLADVIDRPMDHPELAQAGERDLPNLLYQITNGLRHLHKLRIVHRDLKPQNILVSFGKDKKPRLVVSDFGLCKKLEGEQSSFRATTAHAAGTSGWRAPELLLDDDTKDRNSALLDASTDGNSSSTVLNTDLLPNRRATRAIDIFSLGLIFFYVLTKGCHPFDCGDRFMREVNIRQGKYDLGPLEVLGDFAYEAKDLIESMLSGDPKRRPQAHEVMAHPFFWPAKKRLNFLCDVSDHFEKEKRDPPTPALQELESYASQICGGDFIKPLGKDFVESMNKQRKYTGTRLLDLLRALRNKRNHYEDMSEKLKKDIGPFPEGYLSFWTRRFPQLLVVCWTIVYDLQWDEIDRFRDYYETGLA